MYRNFIGVGSGKGGDGEYWWWVGNEYFVCMECWVIGGDGYYLWVDVGW